MFLPLTVQKRLEEERKHDRPRDKHDRPRPTASRFSNLKNRRTMPVKRLGTSLSARYKFGANQMSRTRGRMQRGVNRNYGNMGSTHTHTHPHVHPNRSRLSPLVLMVRWCCTYIKNLLTFIFLRNQIMTVFYLIWGPVGKNVSILYRYWICLRNLTVIWCCDFCRYRTFHRNVGQPDVRSD